MLINNKQHSVCAFQKTLLTQLGVLLSEERAVGYGSLRGAEHRPPGGAEHRPPGAVLLQHRSQWHKPEPSWTTYSPLPRTRALRNWKARNQVIKITQHWITASVRRLNSVSPQGLSLCLPGLRISTMVSQTVTPTVTHKQDREDFNYLHFILNLAKESQWIWYFYFYIPVTNRDSWDTKRQLYLLYLKLITFFIRNI